MNVSSSNGVEVGGADSWTMDERFGLLIGKADPSDVGARGSSQVASDNLLLV